MAMGKKIATRESYGNTLVELAKEHDDLVVLDADLAGATKTSIFQKAYPDRFIDGLKSASQTLRARRCLSSGRARRFYPRSA